jgi:hypothetical protein
MSRSMRTSLQHSGKAKRLRKAVKPGMEMRVEVLAAPENTGYDPYDNSGAKMTVDIEDITARNQVLRGANRPGQPGS